MEGAVFSGKLCAKVGVADVLLRVVPCVGQGMAEALCRREGNLAWMP